MGKLTHDERTCFRAKSRIRARRAMHITEDDVQERYGRYSQAGADLNRGGGHIVTVTRVRGYVGSNESS